MDIFINDEDFECDAMFYRQPYRDLIRRRDDEVVLDELRISWLQHVGVETGATRENHIKDCCYYKEGGY